MGKYQERREGKKMIKKDVVHACSVVKCPPMKVVGIVGYVETPRGLRALSTVWAQNLDVAVKRRMYKNWMNAKKKAFTKYADKHKKAEGDKNSVARDLQRIKKYCSIVRVLCATQIGKLKMRQHKAHVMEIQVIGVTRGKGMTGPIKRFGCSRLNRKSHRGLRKVACIGAWHPSAVKWTVGRRGQQGYHSRTQIHQKIYRVGTGAIHGCTNNAMCDADAIDKNITPIGGFPHYGVVNQDYLLIKGGVMGTRKRPLVIRKTLFPCTKSW